MGACAVAYLPAIGAGFIWDDDATLTANPLIRASDGLARFWASTQPADYWPLSSTTLWLEWRLWGAHAAGYHLTNVALHAAICLLVWKVLRQLGLPGAWLASLVFALHPVNAESVAWIAQRKNLVAMLMGLASASCFLRDERDRGTRFGTGWYAASLAAFALALLGKGSAAPLPLAFAGAVRWRRPLARTDVLRLAPFAGFAAAAAVVNVWFQSHGLREAVRSAGPLERLLGAAAALWFYLAKAVVPAGLSLVYPLWHVHAAAPAWWLPAAFAAALTLVLARVARLRPLLFAWGWFCLMLAPALGFTDITFMQYSLVADHYQHFALIAVAAVAGGALAGWTPWSSAPDVPAPAAAWSLPRRIAATALILALGTLTFLQCRTYRSNETIFQAVLRHDPLSWIACQNLGIERERAGDPAGAGRYYRMAIERNPQFAAAHYNLGRLLAGDGRFADAAAEFAAAVRIRPGFTAAVTNLGSALLQSGDTAGAIARYRESVAQEPGDATTRDYLGVALARDGRIGEAIAEFAAATRLDPDSAQAHQDLGDALESAGRAAEADAEHERARRIGSGPAAPSGR